MKNMTKCKLRIEMLGPLQVRVGEDKAVFRTDALRVLLAYLAAHQGIAQRRDTLAGLLSPDRPDQERAAPGAPAPRRRHETSRITRRGKGFKGISARL